MSQHFDTNLDNYELYDLEQMFSLRKPYTKRDIDTNCNALKIKVSTHHDGGDEVLQNLLNFIMSARNTLEKKMDSDFMKLPTADIMENNSHDIIDRRVAAAGGKENAEAISTVINARDETNQKSIWSCKNVFQQLSIDTAFRDNYGNTRSSDLHISLQNPIKKVVSMELSSLELPSRINFISEKHGNNTFKITDVSSGTHEDIIIPDGRYSEEEMNAALNTQFAKGIFQSGKDLSGVNMAIGDDGKVSLVNNDSRERTFNFIPNGNIPLNQTLGWILGFRWEEYTFGKSGENKKKSKDYRTLTKRCKMEDGTWKIKTMGTGELEESAEETKIRSEGSFDSAQLKYMYIMIDDYNRNIVNSTVVPAFNTQPLNNNIMGKIIPRTYGASSSETTYYECSNIEHSNTKLRKYLGPVDIHKLHIQLLDSFGRVLDMDNMDYSLSLSMECVYD